MRCVIMYKCVCSISVDAEKLLKSKSVSHFELLKLYRVLAEKLQGILNVFF